MGNIFGYIRVSSRDQNEDRQLIAFCEFIGLLTKNRLCDCVLVLSGNALTQ